MYVCVCVCVCVDRTKINNFTKMTYTCIIFYCLSHCKAYTSSVITTPQPLHDIVDCLNALALLVVCAGEKEAVVCLPVPAGFRLLAWLLAS